ncbi:MAG: class I SAM-dependent methyltransferase [Bryobacteraceae bacterium]
MERLYQPKLPDLASAIGIVSDLPAFLAQSLEHESEGVERLSVDRYLQILDAIESRALFDSSLLDIGCSSGFFSYLFAITTCRQVTAVDDSRAALSGYSDDAFLRPLRAARQEYGLDHIEIVDTPIERFLASAERIWDIVLCLSVLHHFYTGYGEHPDRGRMTPTERLSLFQSIGRTTGTVLYLEVDHGRVPADFLDEFSQASGLHHSRVIGSSSSAVGETRSLMELWR